MGLLEELRPEATQAWDDRSAASRKSWEQWQVEAMAGGARALHRYPRRRAKWVPTLVETAPGAFTASPEVLLAHEAEQLAKLWRPGEAQPLWVPDRATFAKATPDQLRRASSSFSAATAQSLGGFQPRQYALLSDEALETRHIGIGTLPCQQERMRPDMTQLKTTDRGQRTQFRVFDCQ